jgi:hypothetical protein
MLVIYDMATKEAAGIKATAGLLSPVSMTPTRLPGCYWCHWYQKGTLICNKERSGWNEFREQNLKNLKTRYLFQFNTAILLIVSFF